MALLKFQAGVQVPWTVYIAVAAANAANVLGIKSDLLCTSGNDKVHMKGSRHYTDEALDFRTRTLQAGEREALKVEVKRRLGKDFDVIIEDPDGPNEHMHVEHDPKP